MQVRTNEAWLQALRGDGPQQEGALKDLREGVLRGLRAFLARAQGNYPALRPADVEPLAQDCAQEALLTILKRLDTFRGESRFTTWAYQIAIRLALDELRRKRWQGTSPDPSRIGDGIPHWPIKDTSTVDPERRFHQAQVWKILQESIEVDLTPRQRSALVAHVFQEMPLDMVAEWLGTNRDAVYKLLHDARRRLKRALLERRLSQEELLGVFAERG